MRSNKVYLKLMEGDFSIPDSSAKAIYCSTPYFFIAYARFTMAGRPASATTIVPPNTVLAAGVMALEELGPVQLRLMLGGNVRRQMNSLAERGLLHNSYTCPQCQVLCSLVVQWASQDGFRWRCRQCQQRASVRKGSFFKSNLPLGKLMWMLLSWASDTPVHHVAWHLDVSQHTLVDWSNFIRDVCAEDTRRNAVQLGGFDANGQPIVVEIDESYFFHRKYHRGRFHNGLWVFGAIKRESGRCMLQVVADRTAQTLLPIIQQWCLPGTHIISDGWPSYQNIPQLNGGVFLQDDVIHQVNFVDPNNPEIHTQNIENLWMRAKCKLRRQFGTTRPLLATYLEEFMWQQRNKDHRRRLAGLLGCIRQQYP